MSKTWTEYERKAWAPPEKLTVSQCADRYRVLSAKESSNPGKWRSSLTPYLIDIMDAMGDRKCEMVVVKKPAQVGVSEATRNGIFYWVKFDPGPCLLVYPNELSTREQVEERLKPMVRSSLVAETTEKASDIKLTKLALTSMEIYVGWATSPQRLASRPVRYVILDEVNKFVDWSGKDADPISLAKARTRTWKRRKKIVLLSTPTIREAQISKAFEDCDDQKTFTVPCPKCEHYQPLVWAQVKWPQRDEAETHKQHESRIVFNQLARFECEDCQYGWSDIERLAVIRKGRWRSQEDAPENPRSIGFQFTVMGTPWCNLSELAAKFLKVKDDPAKLMEFINQDLGEDFEEQQKKIEKETRFNKVAQRHPRNLIPCWAGVVLCAVDTQKNHYVYSVRAFGKNFRSRLIDFGRADTFKQLETMVLSTHWPIADTEGKPTADSLQVYMLLIDARGGKSTAGIDKSRTDEVYRWSMSDPRIRPIMGHGGATTASKAIKLTNTHYVPPQGMGYKIVRYILDVNYFKDVLSHRISHEDHTLWELNGDVDIDYIKQLTSEHKVLVRKGQRANMLWKVKSEKAANHYWDCETYLCAAAVMAKVELLPDQDHLIRARAEESKRRSAVEQQGRNQTEGKKPWVQGKGWWK